MALKHNTTMNMSIMLNYTYYTIVLWTLFIEIGRLNSKRFIIILLFYIEISTVMAIDDILICRYMTIYCHTASIYAYFFICTYTQRDLKNMSLFNVFFFIYLGRKPRLD